MPQRKQKRGKNRLDKFYQLAKEQGYRSRASFKLIQLNKKYDFLSTSKTCIDLCAAPGGWMQVAAKFMPAPSTIIGVDLDPIKPIRDCQSMVADITTPRCRDLLKKSLKTKNAKADIVLHDGAPNMGTSWAQDAYDQNCLTLKALQLATEFLRPGGWFVSKVFRSADYNSVLYVMQQLFTKVEATKPQASRNESAEIFVVCRGFHAPKKIDPKLLDPKYVFKELDPEKKPDVFHKKGKPSRVGYADDANIGLFKQIEAVDFIAAEDPVLQLGEYNRISFESDASKEIQAMDVTTIELQACCDDLQVLNKKDFRRILKWRLAVIKEQRPPEEEKKDAPEEKELTEQEKEDLLDVELSGKVADLERRQKKALKRARKKLSKYQQRINLNMEGTGQLDTVDQEGGLFELKRLKSKEAMDDMMNDFVPDVSVSDSEDETGDGGDGLEGKDYNTVVETMLDSMYDRYLESSGRKTKLEKKRYVKDLRSDPTLLSDEEDDQEPAEDQEEVDEIDFDKEEQEELRHPLLVYPTEDNEEAGDDGAENKVLSNEKSSKRAAFWFSKPLFQELGSFLGDDKKDEDEDDEDEDDDEEEEEEEEAQPQERAPKRQKKTKEADKFSVPLVLLDRSKFVPEQSTSTPSTTNSAEAKNKKRVSKKEVETSSNFEEVPVEWDSEGEYEDNERAEALAIGGKLAKKELKKHELVSQAYNRYSFFDLTDCPPWFIDNDNENTNVPELASREEIQEIMDKNLPINVRTIKKVAEAKARKKMKSAKKYERLKEKAESITTQEGLSAKDKSREIERLYKRDAKKAKRPSKIYVIGKKGRTIGGSSKLNTRIKLVDRRMKKDLRGEKRSEKRKKEGGPKRREGGGNQRSRKRKRN